MRLSAFFSSVRALSLMFQFQSAHIFNTSSLPHPFKLFPFCICICVKHSCKSHSSISNYSQLVTVSVQKLKLISVSNCALSPKRNHYIFAFFVNENFLTLFITAKGRFLFRSGKIKLIEIIATSCWTTKRVSINVRFFLYAVESGHSWCCSIFSK